MKEIELVKEKNNLQSTKCYLSFEAPKIPQAAMEYLSRTWSCSSSAYVHQLLSANSLMSTQHQKQDKNVEHADEDCKLQMCDDILQNSDNLWMVVPRGKVQNSVSHKHRKLHFGWKGILSTEVLRKLSWGHRREKKDEMRMHAAQVNATLSVAKLAAAIAGVVANSHMEPLKSRDLSIACLGEETAGGHKGMVVASAMALVAAVCAEAAESIGASKKQVALAMDMGAEIRDPADLVTLTANAATCLRGVSALKLRGPVNNFAFALEGSKVLGRGAHLPVLLPTGGIQLRWAYVYVSRDKLMLKLRKKCLYGAFNAYKEYIILEKIEEATKGNSPRKENGCFVITLSTSGGTIQLLFDDEKHYIIWKNAIFILISNLNKNINFN